MGKGVAERVTGMTGQELLETEYTSVHGPADISPASLAQMTGLPVEYFELAHRAWARRERLARLDRWFHLCREE